MPTSEIRDAINRLAAMEEYQHIRYEAVEFYFDRFLSRELMSLIDESWDLEQLAAADPDMVKVAFIMLLRDMMQAHRSKIVTGPRKQSLEILGVEQFIAGLFYETQSPIQPYQDWLSAVQSQDEEDSASLGARLTR